MLFFPVQQLLPTCCSKYIFQGQIESLCLITAIQNLLSLSRVLMLLVTDQSDLCQNHFIKATKNINTRLPQPPLPYLHVLGRFCVIFVFDLPSFFIYLINFFTYCSYVDLGDQHIVML